MLSTSQHADVNGHNVNVVQIVGDNNAVAVGGRPALKLITVAALRRKYEKRVPLKTERDLLVSQRCTLDLVGREREMDSLHAWLRLETPLSIRCITGQGGAGKTRLAMELLRTLPEGWQGGFLETDELKRAYDHYHASRWPCSMPTLIVIDYAATFGEKLRKWLLELSYAEKGKKVRILLLERHASLDIGWYADLASESDRTENERGLAVCFEPQQPYPLPPLQTETLKRNILQGTLNAHAAFRKKTPLLLPEQGTNPEFDAKLSDPAWNSPLTLMMAALVAAWHGLAHVLTLSRTDLAFEVAEHEVGRLRRFSKDKFFLLMTAAVTLCKGLDRRSALRIIKGLPERLDELDLHLPQEPKCNDALSFVDLLENACGIDEERNTLTPVQPDIIGEALVLKLLHKRFRLEQTNQGQLIAFLAETAPAQVIEFSVRAAQDFSHGMHPGEHAAHPEPVAWLNHLIDIAEERHDATLLTLIEILMPEHTVCLQETALRVTTARIAILKASPETPDDESEIARLLHNRAYCLSEVGKREEALEAAQKAVEAYGDLAAKNPNAYAPDLAMSLNNLANRLSAVGKREEALEAAQKAVEAYGDLATKNPDAYRPDLAGSLNNLATFLSAVGKREAALEAAQKAVEAYGDLATKNPDAYGPDLAGSLNNLANLLSEVGKREAALDAAQQAVEAYGDLATKNPDAYGPDLAGSLNNLASFLSAVGKREAALDAAQQAVEMRKELATKNPDAYGPDLAMSLNNLASFLSAVGKREAALDAAQQAVEMRKELATKNPDAYGPDLAMSCGVLCQVYQALEQWDEAVQAAEEGIRTLFPLFEQHPPAFSGLIAALCRVYLQSAVKAGREPDVMLLAPIMKKLQALEAEVSEEEEGVS